MTRLIQLWRVWERSCKVFWRVWEERLHQGRRAPVQPAGGGREQVGAQAAQEVGQRLARLRLGWRSPPTTTSHWRHPVRRKQEVTKPEQEELWGWMEEQVGAGIFGAFKLLVSKQTLVSRGVAGLP